MNGKYIRLAPPSENELHQNGKPFAQFDPKTIYLVEGADPIVVGRASSQLSSGRMSDMDNGYLKVPRGQTALGREHALLCLRNDTLYIAMKDRDGLILHDGVTHHRLLSPCSEYFPLRTNSRVRLGINGAFAVNFLVDVIFTISDTDLWTSPVKKRFIRALP
ncbi:hypothetical protein MSAN_00243100 [Mycena sanguinolenta]|uniref:FHA domain-containing protein n=1 Tax=Mycena sanguinolenta TaxID=230812 RepID=A0A8H6ZKQ4_9AGAR|nr:hypothetical protein MSAN_00243100 [Mycena sanguinolenta]